jgi:hypothetical protein
LPSRKFINSIFILIYENNKYGWNKVNKNGEKIRILKKYINKRSDGRPYEQPNNKMNNEVNKKDVKSIIY